MANWQIKKFRKMAKGFRGKPKNCIRSMIPRVQKALQYAYRDRRVKKREFRQEWITKIGAGSQEHGIEYKYLINGLNNSNINLDRKILSDLAENEPFSFKAVCEEIKIQKNFQSEKLEDMDFLDAVNRNYLVYGDVKNVEEMDNARIPYGQVRKSVDKDVRDKISITHDRRNKYFD